MAGGDAPRKGVRRLRVALLLALLPGLLGLGLIRWPPAEGLERIGLDLLFLARGKRTPPPEVCVVALDEASYAPLELESREYWPRGLHGRLIETLNREGATAIAFDILFEDPGDPEQDMQLLWALEDAGNVVLAWTIDQVEDPLFRSAKRREPWQPFAEAAVLGQANLPRDRDETIRSAWPAPDGYPGLALAAYEVATGDRSLRDSDTRLIDYYGPARTIKTVSLYQALDPEQYLPEGFFRDKVVFVGLSEVAASGKAAKDAFPTPFTGARGQTTYGVEIHATLAANLLEQREIRLPSVAVETLLLLALPVVALLIFIWLGPLYGALALVALAAAPWAVGYLGFSREQLWLPTVIPSAIQLPLAYTVSVVWYYLTTVRERERVKRAFSRYLSPETAQLVSEDPTALNLGGEEIVATAMFTDIAGFTSVAESMTAEETAAMLNSYFSEATGHVFDTGGTLVKFIGDAVFAIWGAPIRVGDHAERACRTALALARMDLAHGEDEDGDDPAKRLRTRIGVHTGPMLVGNLGSAQRFDYTAIGDAVNLASRIEGINKMFGTRAIVSGDTLDEAGGGVLTRRLGRVRLVGRAEPVTLHELVATTEEGKTSLSLERFEAALVDYEDGAFARAAEGFREARELAGGSDGPALFYVKLCERLEREGVDPSWDGVIEASSK